MNSSILLDLLLAGLMVATIVYAVALNRRLTAFRQGKDEMRAMIADFTAAIENARASMGQLKEATEASAKSLDGLIIEAKVLRDDLGFLIERGSAVADRLAGDPRAVRPSAPAMPAADDRVGQLRRILETTR